MNIYACFFEHRGKTYRVDSDRGIAFFTDGFWVDAFMELSRKQSDIMYWIPSHKIEYIQKIQK